ncbi:sugar kinase [Chromatiales bacterium (ex Bugula neritina AB1)]|nr:sugar kinase [Chromatiales bacterium (ex Bugula neritina AB1)]
MKHYDLYGIGNALVDMEYRISDQKLEELGVDKGLMTLIEEDQHHALVDKLSELSHKKACGGSAANTVIALAQLGGDGFYTCKVANDEPGDFYLQDMADCNVDTNLDGVSRVSGNTGKCIVMVTPDADRTMNTYLGVTVNLSEDEVVADAIAQSKYMYMEGYVVTSDSGRAAAIKAAGIAREAGVPTVLTLSDPNMVNFFRDGLLQMAGDDLDLLFCNEAEATLMTGTDSVEAAAAELKTLARRFAITVGADGSLVYDGTDFHKILADKVDVIDTNGAGDMYAGAFLYGLTHSMSFVQSAELASRAASKIVTHFGPRLPTEQTRALLG